MVVAHNGTIANDKYLESKLGLIRRSRIDTAILPPLLEKLWDGSLNGLRDVLINYVVGSYALAIMDTRKPGRVWLATNFKPLYMAWYGDLKALFFASLDDYLIDDWNKPIWGMPVIKRVEPYTVMEIGIDGAWSTASLRKKGQVKKRVLVIASGGLDSTTAATYLLKQGYDIALLHFNYGHRAETQEDRAIRRIAEFLNVPLLEVNMDFFKIVR
ncbi:MAG: 7-cyano-7-deazaguanine synthase, partial [Vulcanisaeta sp.]